MSWRTWIRRTVPLGALLALALCSVRPADAQFWKKKQPYADGSQVRVTGSVTDENGQPIRALLVRLRASRREMNFKKLHKEDVNPVLRSAYTNSVGEFVIDWTWHHYYNHFELQAVVEVPLPRSETEQRVLQQVDVTDRMGQGTPVVVPVTLEDTAFLNRVREFEASVAGEAQQRVREQQGLPDKVDTLTAVEHTEETWWYFKTGMVFRFADHKLVEVENFDPVVGFGEKK